MERLLYDTMLVSSAMDTPLGLPDLALPNLALPDLALNPAS